jgi:hypothetical protein
MSRAAKTCGVAAIAVATACHPSATNQSATSTSRAGDPGALAPPPVDHLAPGELVEGTDQALGILLPEGVRVDESFGKVVYASGAVTVHPLVQYLRTKLQDGNLREGENSATFEHVTVRGTTERPLSIHIAEVRRKAIIEIRDTTEQAAPNLPDEPARWKNVGLTPNGRIADPTHLE